MAVAADGTKPAGGTEPRRASFPVLRLASLAVFGLLAACGVQFRLQALAAEPDCVETGECLDVLSGVVDDALRYVEAARGRIAQVEGGDS